LAIPCDIPDTTPVGETKTFGELVPHTPPVVVSTRVIFVLVQKDVAPDIAFGNGFIVIADIV